MARKVNTTKKTEPKVEKISKNTLVASSSGIIYMKDLLNAIETGYLGKYKITVPLNQRETDVKSETPGAIMADYLYFGNVNRLSKTTQAEFAGIINFNKEHAITTIVFSINEDESLALNENSQHRLHALYYDILGESTRGVVPTVEYAKKKKIYQKAYHEIYEVYGGKKLSELPAEEQEMFFNLPVEIELYSTTSHEVNVAIYNRNNCGKPLNRQDKAQGNYSNTAFFQILRATSKSFKNDTYTSNINFKENVDVENPMTQDQFKTLKSFFGGKKDTATLDALTRFMLALNDAKSVSDKTRITWPENTTADDVRETVFSYYENIDEATVKADIKEMIAALVLSIKICCHVNSSSTSFHTGLIHSIIKNNILEKEEILNTILEEYNNTDIQRKFSTWINKTISVESRKGVVKVIRSTYLSNTAQERERWETAEDKFKAILKGYNIKLK